MISAVLNTYNEEKNIERCLSSLGSFADEIILVDMGSKDQTLDKARKFDVKISHHPYTGFVEPARNYAIGKARGDWIFLIDADEEATNSLKSRLKKLSSLEDKSYFRIPRKNIIFGSWIKHAYWWPDYQIRFFKKGAVSWGDKIHSIPMTRGGGYDLNPEEENAVIHYNYQTVEQFIERLNRYTNIQAKELYLEGHKFSWKKLIGKSTQEFISRYFQGEGYKDGVHGLVISLLQAVSEIVLYAKLWELEGFSEEKVDIEELEKQLDERNKEEKFWIIDKKLKKEISPLSKLKLKLERKINPA